MLEILRTVSQGGEAVRLLPIPVMPVVSSPLAIVIADHPLTADNVNQ
jgi:hypothetical protein